MRGIHNVGATCYINATLQSLFHCEAFVAFLSAHRQVSLIKHLWEMCASRETVDPRSFLNALQRVFPLRLLQQNDICEFFTLFVDCLNDQVKVPRSKPVPLDSKSAETIQDISALMAYNWDMTHYSDHSPLKNLFYGQFISQIRCAHCDKITHNYEVFLQLTLPIQGDSMSTCLSHFFAPEETQGWRCDVCKHSQPSQKILRLWRLPRILIVTYKRFTNALQKINHKVATPYKLNLYPYMIGPQAYAYRLKAAAFHVGHPSNGHYFAVCKDTTWNVYDDEIVKITEETNINPDDAYMLFYEAE